MSTDPEFGTILDVLSDGSCNVRGDFGAVYYNVDVYATGYTPAQGDDVLLAFVGGAAVVFGARNFRRPAVPTITVQDATPTGANWRQLGAIFQDTNAGDDTPTLVGVRSSPRPTPPTAPDHPVNPATSGTWTADGYGWEFGDVIQGQVSEFPHARTGLWLYPSLTDSRTATGLTIRVHRKTGSGPGGNVSLRFFLHAEAGAPSATPTLYESFDGGGGLTLSPGAEDTFTLPPSWAALLAGGTRTGVAISSASTGDYARCDGGALTLSFAT